MQLLGVFPSYSQKIVDQIFLKYIGSTHPRRAIFYFNHTSYFTILRKISTHRLESQDKEINESFYQHDIGITPLKGVHLIFIGDSHVEFLSRVKANSKQTIYHNTSAIWLGPKTLMGYAFQSNLDQETKRIANLLKPTVIAALKNKKRIKLIWSMGTIDIRLSIYELSLRKVLPTEDQILDLFEDSMKKLMLIHTPKILEHLPKTNIDVSVASCTNILEGGHLPKSLTEIKKIRQLELFPTFGTLEQRDNWMNQANARTKQLCNIHDFGFFEFALSDNSQDRHRLSKDGIHLTSPAQLDGDILRHLHADGIKNV